MISKKFIEPRGNKIKILYSTEMEKLKDAVQDGDKWISGACWLVRLTESVSSRPLRDLSQNKADHIQVTTPTVLWPPHVRRL